MGLVYIVHPLTLKMAFFRYLSKKHLEGFGKYKYSAIETNPLSVYVLQPWWSYVVELCPLWVAPNVLTFVGFLMLVSIYIILAYYDFDYMTTSNTYGIIRDPIPWWVWLYSGVFHFVAQTLDGIDGKQARRTKSSSPLGELFDHGLDSVSCLFLPLCFFSAVGCGPQWGGTIMDVYFCMLAIMGGFLLSHWEKYITGTLYLPWSYEFGQTGAAVAYLVTAAVSDRLWLTEVVGGVTVALICSWLIKLGFVAGIPVSLINVYNFYKNGNEAERCRTRSITVLLSPLLSFTIMVVICTSWALLSPSDIIFREPRIFMMCVGVVFSNIACRIIVSQMSHTNCQWFNVLMIPVMVAMVISFIWPQYEVHSLYLLTALVILAHLHYGVSVVQELAKHFNIYVFSVDKPPAPTATEGH